MIAVHREELFHRWRAHQVFVEDNGDHVFEVLPDAQISNVRS